MVKGKMADILTKRTSMEVNRKETADHYCLHIQAEFWLVSLLHKLSETQMLAEVQQVLLNSFS